MQRYLIWLLLILLIAVRYFFTRPVYQNGDRVRITATVYSDPLFFGKTEYIKLANLRVFLPGGSGIEYGDRVAVEGVVESGELTNAKLLKKEEGNFLSGFRSKVIEFYKSVLPQPESGALSGIVFGARGAMPSDFYNQTKTSGLFHLVIPSGLKTTLVISFLIGFFALFVRRQIAIPFVILTIILYLLLTGFDAPIVRSAIMASVAFTAQIFGRVVNSWRVFFLTAFIMLIFQPDWALDIGFYISFASVAFLMLYEKDFAGYLKSFKLPKVFIEDFSASLIAQLGAAPILYLAFNQLSLLSPVANVLVLWMIPFLMALGLSAGILGLVFPEAGRLLLYVSLPMLWFFSKVTQVFGG